MTDQIHNVRSDIDDLRALRAEPREISATLRRVKRRRSERHRKRGLLAMVALALAAVTLTAPSARSAVGGAFDQFSGFFTGTQTSPGAEVDTFAAPAWPDGAQPGSPREIARAGDEVLVGYRASDGSACLSYGRHADACDTASGWKARLARGSVVPLTTTQTDSTSVALWGISGAGVARVRLTYQDGGEVTAGGANGFVVLATPERAPRLLEGLNENGIVVASVDVSGLQWKFSR